MRKNIYIFKKEHNKKRERKTNKKENSHSKTKSQKGHLKKDREIK
jgi:hypothetical protein